MTVSFDLDLPLSLYPLTFLDEGDEVTVGRADTDSYAVLPADGAALLRQLVSGMSPRQGKQWYAQHYGEDVDIEDFLAVLDELELVVRAGDAAGPLPAPAPVRWQRLGRALFSPVAWVCFAALIAGAVVAMVARPQLVPGYQNLFFTHYLVLLELGLFLGQFPLILLHEGFHALAGRRLGLSSSLRISRRLYFVVFETALDGLVVVPRRQRYLPMLAGMLADALVIAVLTIIAAIVVDGGGALTFIGRLCLALAFATVLRLLWQCYVFLRTDIYYLVVTVLGCVDMHTVAVQMLRNRVFRLLGRSDRLADESLWHPKDRAVARWYSWIMLAGYVFLIATGIAFIVPSVARMFSIVVSHLSGSPTSLQITDVAVFLGLNVAQLAIALVLIARARRARTAVAPA